MAKAGLKAIYLSGWQVAADANNAARCTRSKPLPGGQRAAVVRRHQQRVAPPTRSSFRKTPRDDCLLPIVADAEAGSRCADAFELMKHDRRGPPPCTGKTSWPRPRNGGHMGGKVLVPGRSRFKRWRRVFRRHRKRAVHYRRPHRRQRRFPADQRHRRKRQAVPHRRAHGGGLS